MTAYLEQGERKFISPPKPSLEGHMPEIEALSRSIDRVHLHFDEDGVSEVRGIIWMDGLPFVFRTGTDSSGEILDYIPPRQMGNGLERFRQVSRWDIAIPETPLHGELPSVEYVDQEAPHAGKELLLSIWKVDFHSLEEREHTLEDELVKLHAREETLEGEQLIQAQEQERQMLQEHDAIAAKIDETYELIRSKRLVGDMIAMLEGFGLKNGSLQYVLTTDHLVGEPGEVVGAVILELLEEKRDEYTAFYEKWGSEKVPVFDESKQEWVVNEGWLHNRIYHAAITHFMNRLDSRVFEFRPKNGK
jgi:hypothetical protein